MSSAAMLSTTSSESSSIDLPIDTTNSTRNASTSPSRRRPLSAMAAGTVSGPPFSSATRGVISPTAISSGPQDREFSDMPNLSSFRSWDEKSAASSPIIRADCDMSLPSLSSFRIDDLSMASSYHSRGSTATNHLSNFSEESQSVEGWSSFTSEHVSKSDLDDSENEDNDNQHRNRSLNNTDDEYDGSDHISKSDEEAIIQMMSAVSVPAISSRPPAAIEAKSILRNKDEAYLAGTISVSDKSSKSLRNKQVDDRGKGGSGNGILKQSRPPTPPQRSSTSSLEESLEGHLQATSIRNNTTTKDDSIVTGMTVGEGICASTGTSSSGQNSEKNRKPHQEQAQLKTASGHQQMLPTRGSMERNESLSFTELSKSIAVKKEEGHKSSSSSFRYSPDGSSNSLKGGDSLPRLPRRTSTMPNDDYVDGKGDGKDSSRIGMAKNDTKLVSNDDESDKADNEQVSISDSSSDGDLSLAVDDDGGDESSTDCSVQTVDEETMDHHDSTTDVSLVGSEASLLTDSEHTSPQTDSLSEEFVVNAANTSDLDGKKTRDSQRAHSFDNPNSREEGKETKLKASDGVADVKYGKNPRYFLSQGRKTAAVHNGERPGTSGTETEIDDGEARGKINDEDKRGNLLRRVSSSLKKVGRNASFRDSFRKIGKKASKLRQMSWQAEKNSPPPQIGSDSKAPEQNK